ncbi:uncharacterized protein [Notamacropus eugenii]|uniref:uncharacterized protein n=1 Tax=Notamacropus eugenii TaxID=9315 RepID=UPI003B66E8E3
MEIFAGADAAPKTHCSRNLSRKIPKLPVLKKNHRKKKQVAFPRRGWGPLLFRNERPPQARFWGTKRDHALLVGLEGQTAQTANEAREERARPCPPARAHLPLPLPWKALPAPCAPPFCSRKRLPLAGTRPPASYHVTATATAKGAGPLPPPSVPPSRPAPQRRAGAPRAAPSELLLLSLEVSKWRRGKSEAVADPELVCDRSGEGGGGGRRMAGSAGAGTDGGSGGGGGGGGGGDGSGSSGSGGRSLRDFWHP